MTNVSDEKLLENTEKGTDQSPAPYIESETVVFQPTITFTQREEGAPVIEMDATEATLAPQQ